MFSSAVCQRNWLIIDQLLVFEKFGLVKRGKAAIARRGQHLKGNAGQEVD